MTATLPSTLTLHEEDTARERAESLNEWMRDARQGLEEVPAIEFRDLEVDGGDTDVDLEVTGRIISVLLAYVAEKDDPDADAPSSPPALHWIPIDRGVRIQRLYNLTSGTRYTLRLRIERA